MNKEGGIVFNFNKIQPFIVIFITAILSVGAWFSSEVYSAVTSDIKENKTQITTLAKIQTESIIRLAEMAKDDEYQKERLRKLERELREVRERTEN